MFKRLNPFQNLGLGDEYTGLPEWREQIFDAMMSAMLLWGLVALIPSIWLSIQAGLLFVAVADVLAYGLIILFYIFRRRIPYLFRAFAFLLIGITVGVVVLLFTGDEGAGLVWIFAIPPFASLLLGLKWGLGFSIFNLATMVAIGIAIALGYADDLHISEFTLSGWVVYATNFLAANAVVTVPLAVLLESLYNSANRQRSRLRELEAISKVSASLRRSDDLDVSMPSLMDTMMEIFDVQAGSIWLYDEEESLLKMKYSVGYVDDQGDQAVIPPEAPGTGLAGRAFASDTALVSVDYTKEESIPEPIRAAIPPGVGGAIVVIRSAENPLGVININTRAPREFTKIEVDLLKTLADITGTAMQRIYLHHKTERQLRQFRALTEIDHVILASFDLQYNLKVLLSSILEELQVDAANVMIYEEESDRLFSVQGQGFTTSAFEQRYLAMGEGNAGTVAQTRKPLFIENLNAQENPRLHRALQGEHLTCYYAVPLIAKGSLRGVLELFSKQHMNRTGEWIDALDALAGRAAIAIDSLKVFESLQQSNRELTLSYDATIAGWSQALELRDKETKGHSQRVTDLTMRLARRVGIEGDDLVNLYRGALLHDIGKMGIPDGILLKAGKLTDDEWDAMKKHPVYARDMLVSIEYLQNAIEIPYSHHEKWDGSGYPLGLVGESIPLPARIFSLADVYDALTSDRPYRKAWPKDEAIQYIRQNAGSHFDPDLVESFLALDLPD